MHFKFERFIPKNTFHAVKKACDEKKKWNHELIGIVMRRLRLHIFVRKNNSKEE